jgi:REP element-mobilizing transposase RayT
MARPLRVEFDRAVYHVMSRGNERRTIVHDDRDRDKWLRLLAATVERYGWRVFSFAMMANHFHLFLQTPQPNLSAGMHHLNGSYAGYFNARHARVGHLMQGRFKSVVIEGRDYCRFHSDSFVFTSQCIQEDYVSEAPAGRSGGRQGYRPRPRWPDGKGLFCPCRLSETGEH